MNTPLTHADLRQFTGDLDRFRHPLARGVIYTPGVQYLAERAGAYWLIDEIALAIAGGAVAKAGKSDDRVLSLHFWKLEVREDRTAELTARADDGVPPFVSKVIPWTDFPLDAVSIWAGFDGRHWTLYLPSEH
ncbi:MAG: hypothetical protein IPM18_01030 [Phycisphaerales bacterium]|nr:hypothetical protein [Phycisphaerales bacterium]